MVAARALTPRQRVNKSTKATLLLGFMLSLTTETVLVAKPDRDLLRTALPCRPVRVTFWILRELPVEELAKIHLTLVSSTKAHHLQPMPSTRCVLRNPIQQFLLVNSTILSNPSCYKWFRCTNNSATREKRNSNPIAEQSLIPLRSKTKGHGRPCPVRKQCNGSSAL